MGVIYAAALLAVSGCGGGQSAQLGAKDAAMLHRDVQNARAAAAAGLPQTAHAALGSLRRDANRLAAQGALNPADARTISIQVGDADGRISEEVQPPVPAVQAATPPAATSPAAPPAPPSAGNGNGQDKAKGNGKDKGKGKGNGKGNGGGDGGD